MTRTLPPLRLTGATVLRDGALQRRSIAFANGRITKGPLPEVDLSGYYILPGIIDLHGDAFNHHLAPRSSAPVPLETGLRATDRDAAANGVTTAWLAQSWSWEGGMRGPEFAEDLMLALEGYRPQAGTDLRIQIRCETHTTDTAERLLRAVRRHRIDYVVFNNHLDETLHLSVVRPESIVEWASKSGRSARDYMEVVYAAQKRKDEVPRHLCRLAEAFDTLGVVYGSHNDPDGDTRETFSMIGAKICEFPTARSAAALARAVGDPVLMGAPNIVRGRSQAGGVSARDLVRAGLCDALVSDYHYPSLAQAAFALVDTGLKDIAGAWAMISEKPAEIIGLHDRGVLAQGRRADLVVVNAETRLIEATIAGGRLTHLCGEAGNRFLTRMTDLAVAAE